MQYTTGDKYEGHWKDGKMNGRGEFSKYYGKKTDVQMKGDGLGPVQEWAWSFYGDFKDNCPIHGQLTDGKNEANRSDITVGRSVNIFDWNPLERTEITQRIQGRQLSIEDAANLTEDIEWFANRQMHDKRQAEDKRASEAKSDAKEQLKTKDFRPESSRLVGVPVSTLLVQLHQMATHTHAMSPVFLGVYGYEGAYYENERNGMGKMAYDNNDVYQGFWMDNRRHNQGKMTFANGDEYDGTWENDKMNIGVYTKADGTWKFKGEFKGGDKTKTSREIKTSRDTRTKTKTK